MIDDGVSTRSHRDLIYDQEILEGACCIAEGHPQFKDQICVFDTAFKIVLQSEHDTLQETLKQSVAKEAKILCDLHLGGSW